MFAQLFLGFILGLRHSADADHVVAVSGLLSDPSRPVSGHMAAARLGAWWGLGHMLAVFAAGCVVVAVRTQIPAWLEWSLEFVVALVLIGIGAHTIRNCYSGRYHFHFHRHGQPAPATNEHSTVTHAHLHFHSRHEAHDPSAHDTHLPPRARLRPLAIGMIHGLAGSAGLTLLVLTTIPSPWLGILYLLVFGVGATAGMALLSTALSLPLLRAGAGTVWLRNVRIAAGVANCALGIFLAASALL